MTAQSYEAFIAQKSATTRFDGIEIAPSDLHPSLKPHQRDLVRWALRKGRAAIFADTGLGKSFSQLEWARVVAERGRVLILAPLGVAQQTVREGERWGVPVRYLREDDESVRIVVTNYDMLHAFDPSRFVGVALDESSILKNHTGSTRNALVQSFAATPYRTCWTATPAPNDHTELGNHSEFLGVKTRAEMLAEFFVHDGGSTQDWRLKGHATAAFWKWLATWGAVVRSPADLGHDDTEYRLPPLREHSIVIETDDGPVPSVATGMSGMLFADDARTLHEQRALRRVTLGQRVAAAVEAVNRDPKAPALVWCELNDEQDALEEAFGDRAWSIRGADTLDQKEQRIAAWLAGRRAVMIGKPSMLGMGLNFQHCGRQVFVAASHSYEQRYQAVRRCWRFGRTAPVDVWTICADRERLVVENYRRKEADAARMAAEMAAQVGDSVRAEVCGASGREWVSYLAEQPIVVPAWMREEQAA